jgi:hypothetical protein
MFALCRYDDTRWNISYTVTPEIAIRQIQSDNVFRLAEKDRAAIIWQHGV